MAFLRFARFIDAFESDSFGISVQSRFGVIFFHAATGTSTARRSGRSVVVFGGECMILQFGQFLVKKGFRKELLQNGITFHGLVSGSVGIIVDEDHITVAFRF